MNPVIQNYLKFLQNQQQPAKPKFSAEDISTAWFSVGKVLNNEYVFDDIAKEMFPQLFNHLKKGVCFCGSKGIGKTLNLDIFSRINTDLYKIKTEVWEVTELEIQYKASGATILENLGNTPALVINDIGIESKELNDFGTIRNIIADLLFIRYRAFQTRGFKTYLSSNMKWDSILAHYGSRLSDRMVEMFVPIEIKGESKRK